MGMNQETVLDDYDFIVSETDDKGKIILVNDDFVRISEYAQEELIGQPHSLVRHQDMPSAAFKDLWETIKKGKVWRGYVKNKTKSGGYYWVYATVSPIVACDGSRGYLSCRKKATPQEIAKISEVYKTMN